MMAGYALFVFGAFGVFRQDRAAAGVAQDMGAFGQAMPHRYTPVKDKAFALPSAVVLRHLFQIFQDTALEVVHIFDPQPQQVVGGFFTTDAAGAEHGDTFIVEPLFVGFPPRGEFTKAGGFGINRAFECADGDFIFVAGVDQRHIGAADQIVPILRLYVMAHLGAGVHIGLAQRHDFLFQLYLHPGKGLIGGGAFFPVQIGTAG